MSHTWTEVDLGVLGHNLRETRRRIPQSTQLMLVVKSDAYGHGMVSVARTAWQEGVRWFTVSHVGEGCALRDALPEARILVVGGIGGADAEPAARAGLVPVLVDEAHARLLSERMAAAGLDLECHAKLDTGMGRLGFAWETAAAALVRVAALPGLRVTGICTHLASAYPHDLRFALEQRARFAVVVKECRSAGVRFAMQHVANSGGILCGEDWCYDGVRPGILAYGYPAAYGVRVDEVRPCLQWKTRIVQLRSVPAGFPVSYDSAYRTSKPTWLAVIDAGYADGYLRAFSNRAQVLIGGRRAPVVGKVTMNLTMVDLGSVVRAAVGDEVVLLGCQGGNAVWADELARCANTIAYEVLTAIRTGDRRFSDGT